MASFKFIHAADLHLDTSALRTTFNLENHRGDFPKEPEHPTRAAFDKLIDLAIRERVAFVLLAGDLFEGSSLGRDNRTALYFRQCMKRLEENNIRGFIVWGNHDYESGLTRLPDWPANVHVFPGDEPGIVKLDQLNCAIHGRSFGVRHVGQEFADSYERALSGLFNIALLHTSLDPERRGGHQEYAPCTPEQLAARGHQYWALGHIHQHQIIPGKNSWLVFPGNLQGRHARETGPKGCMLVEVSNGRISEDTIRHIPLDVVRWHEAEVNLSGAGTDEDICSEVNSKLNGIISSPGADSRVHAVRIRLTGNTRAPLKDFVNRKAIENWAVARMQDTRGIWIEDVAVEVSPAESAIPLEPDQIALLRGIEQEMAAASGEIRRVLLETSHCKDLIRHLEISTSHELSSLPEELGLKKAKPGQADSSLHKALLDEAVRRILAEMGMESGT
ncbi:MAG: hypothetical protein GMKNLPBB_01631 [Myxococcota bacterium]|nr:hypothetical protein [Myxococcota bacterium]